MNEIQYPLISFEAVLPELIVLGTAVLVLMLDLFVKNVQRINITLTASLGLLTAYVCTRNMVPAEELIFAGMIIRDSFSLLMDRVFVIGALMVVLLSNHYAKRWPHQYPEVVALLLFSTLGAMVIASSADLLTLFVGIELLTLSLFILAGADKKSLFSGESSLKYFLLGAFSTGFLVYGMAFIYGTCRTTNLIVIGDLIESGLLEVSPLMVLGFALMLVGLGFKISLVPFHMWAPDVYQGAPTPVVAWIATGSKIAGFVALIRIFAWPGMSFAPFSEYWVDGLWYLALATMIIGNAGAYVQTNLKRIFAYSSIAHGGYLIMGFVAMNEIGLEAVLYYLEAYMFISVGAFGALIVAGKNGRECTTLDDLKGLAQHRPFLAKLMALFTLSLAGVPGTAGFVGKLWLFGAAVQSGYILLAVVGILTTMLSFYYYLRIIVMMYMHDAEKDARFDQYSVSNTIALCIAAFFIILLGVFPNLLWDTIRASMVGL